MISIIIASVNKRQFDDVKSNIQQTIGLPHEIIYFDNANGKRGLCEVYNEGASSAKFELLCFMHEDLEFYTNDWGNKVVDIFNRKPNLGLLGIAGSKYKAASPSGWHVEALDAERSNIIQQFKFSGKDEFHHQINPDHLQLEQVAVVDGVWFCTTKEVWNKKKFDETTFKRFHGYDLDFSIQVGLDFDIFITYDILLKHFSEGSFNQEWLKETLVLHKKWAAILPINKGSYSKKSLRFAEKQTFKAFVKKLKNNKSSLASSFFMLWKIRSIKSLGWINFFRVNFFILKNWSF